MNIRLTPDLAKNFSSSLIYKISISLPRLDLLDQGKDYRLLKQYAKQEGLIQGILITQLCNSTGTQT